MMQTTAIHRNRRDGSVTWACGFENARRTAAKSDESLPIIRLEGVSKTFKGESDDDTVALDDVSVDIDRGEYVSVSGPVRLRQIDISVDPRRSSRHPRLARYWLNGRRTDQLTPAERARVRSLDVGLIFQSFNLIGDMSVDENVEYPLTLRGSRPPERAERVHAALDRVGMTARAKQRPGQLSGGHQQLVAIARAIAGEPPILLADEPTGNLDSKAGDALMADALGAARRRGHRLPGDPQPGLHRARRAPHLSVRRESRWPSRRKAGPEARISGTEAARTEEREKRRITFC